MSDEYKRLYVSDADPRDKDEEIDRLRAELLDAKKWMEFIIQKIDEVLVIKDKAA